MRWVLEILKMIKRVFNKVDMASNSFRVKKK
jgi:hypothetical protein